MKVPYVDLKVQYENLRPELEAAHQEVIEQGQFIGGVAVNRFEQDFANYHKTKHCIGVGSGSDALFLALKMLGIGEGDEVITTAFSYVATANAILRTGAHPVFVDVDKHTFNINLSQILSKISNRTKAIVPVHLYGLMVDMYMIKAIAEQHDLLVVEDAAQAHGALWNGHSPGFLSDAACFSFYPTKQLGAFGDGGAIVTNNGELASRCRLLANNHSVLSGDQKVPGINSRLDPIQAGYLNVKLGHLNKWQVRRQELANRYKVELIDLPIEFQNQAAEATHAWYNFPVLVERRDEFVDFMNSEGVAVVKNYDYILPRVEDGLTQFPIADYLSKQVVSLPIFSEMTDSQIVWVKRCVKSYFGKKKLKNITKQELNPEKL
ncbi:MAG: DegT/DnrJ/EryC1/StrS family aminotransferase [Cyclobacteriaceae bacterium]